MGVYVVDGCVCGRWVGVSVEVGQCEYRWPIQSVCIVDMGPIEEYHAQTFCMYVRAYVVLPCVMACCLQEWLVALSKALPVFTSLKRLTLSASTYLPQVHKLPCTADVLCVYMCV